jgi:hypothetical protein
MLGFLENHQSANQFNDCLTKVIDAAPSALDCVRPYLLKHKPAATIPPLFTIAQNKELPMADRIIAAQTIIDYGQDELGARLRKMWKDGAINVEGARPDDVAALRKLLK